MRAILTAPRAPQWVKLGGKPLLAGLLLSYLAVPSLVAADKRYDILGVIVDAQVRADGSMEIVEHRQYRFVGSFSWASYELPLVGTGGVRDVRLSEEEVEYRLDNSPQPGTFTVEQTPELLRVRWYYRARDEVRVFTLRFVVVDVVRRHQDAAVFYYKFVGTGWERPTASVAVCIVPPQPLTPARVQAWAHGPLWGQVRINDDGSVLADVAQLPKRRFWEVRVLYPPEAFPHVVPGPDSVRATILKEEARWAEQANAERQKALLRAERKRVRKAHGKWLVILLSLGGVLGWWNLYRTYGRRHHVPRQAALSGVPPASTPPALVSYLLFHRTVSANAMVATLLDLARRGLLKIVEEQAASSRSRASDKPDYVLELDRERLHRDTDEGRLIQYERSLLAFLFGQVSNGYTRLRVEELNRHRSMMSSFFSHWRNEVTVEGKARNLYDPDSLRAMTRSLLLSGLLLLLTVLAGFLVEEWTLLLGASTLAVFILSFAIPRRTPEAEAEAQQWKGFRRYLTRSSRTDTALADPSRVDELLVYATALGVRAKALQSLLAEVPEEQWVGFYWYAGGRSRSAAGLADALTSMVSAVSSILSSATGAGGGASVGGGGGAGGSGGGAG
mgnify:CR=1 FL=1